MSQIIRHDRNHRRSRAVVHGNTLYIGGQIGTDLDGDITVQTQQALAQVDKLLAEAGTDRSKVLSVVLWIKSMDDFAAMNAVWDAWIDTDNPPTRCCGQVEMANPRILFEITAVAAI